MRRFYAKLSVSRVTASYFGLLPFELPTTEPAFENQEPSQKSTEERGDYT